MDIVNCIKNYDVICFCETKCDDVKMSNVKVNLEDISFDITFKKYIN